MPCGGGRLCRRIDGVHAWRQICEFVKMPTHGASLYVFIATWMAASYVLMIVLVSSRLDASVQMEVLLGECIFVAYIRD